MQRKLLCHPKFVISFHIRYFGGRLELVSLDGWGLY